MAGTKIIYKSGVADGATAIGHELDTKTSLVTNGAKLLSIKNAGVEKAFIDKDGNLSNDRTRVVLPAAGGTGITSAMDALNAIGGGVVQLTAGTYTVSGAGIGSGVYNNITVQGVGDTTIIASQSGTGYPSGNAVINLNGQILFNVVLTGTITKGATSIFLATPNEYQAGTLVAGDRLWIYGYITGHLGEIQYLDAELHYVVSGNGGTGEIVLDSPIIRTMIINVSPPVSGYVQVFRGGRNNKVKDLRIQYSSGTALSNCVAGYYTDNMLIENITFADYPTGTVALASAIELGPSFNDVVRNCRFKNLSLKAISGYGIFNVFENNVFDNVYQTDVSTSAIITPTGSYDSVWRNNDFNQTLSNAIKFGTGSGAIGLRNVYEKNRFSNIKYFSIEHNSTHSERFIDNTFDTSTDGNAIDIVNSRNCLIKGNTIRNMTQGIRWQNASDSGHIVADNTFENISVNQAISIQEGEDIVVSGNVFKNCVNPIYIYSDRTTVVGNTIDVCTTGIILGTAADLVVANNVVRGASSTGINITSGVTNSIIMGNNCAGQGITNNGGAGNDLIGNKS